MMTATISLKQLWLARNAKGDVSTKAEGARTGAMFRKCVNIACAAALLLCICLAGKMFSYWVATQLAGVHGDEMARAFDWLVAAAAAAHMFLMAVPFVPGAEIGLAMMAALGAEVAPLVYGSTVAALSVAFLVGRLVPEARLVALFHAAGMKRAAEMVWHLAQCDEQERLALLIGQSSPRIVPFLLRNRCLALMIALNIPGNAIIGGGGSICLVAGFSRLIPFPAFLVCVAIAVAPVPLGFFILAH